LQDWCVYASVDDSSISPLPRQVSESEVLSVIQQMLQYCISIIAKNMHLQLFQSLL
jgi:hypothetical protein